MPSDDARRGKFLSHEISDRQTTQLIGLAQGVIADGRLDDAEIHFLHKWLVANEAVKSNPLASALVARIEEILADGVIDEDERSDLHDTLSKLTADDFELGEVIKSTSLPLCQPPPRVDFSGRRFCFTGTFVFGRRKECEAVVAELGAIAGTLTQKTDFLVIGEYATESWRQETFGRKIEKAAGMRDDGIPIAIVSEAHWRKALEL
jgi:NAD-dependent DNA ligase